MTRSTSARFVAAALALVVSAAAPLAARAPTARERYETAQRREADARAAVERVAPTAPTDELDRVVRPARRVVTDYEGVVRRFPTSGYSDNALLQAAVLSQHLYARFGRAADRVAAQKYFDWLVREYPNSPLRRQARAAVRALATIVPASEKAPDTRTVATAPARPAVTAPAPPVERPAAPVAPATPAAASASAGVPAVATLRAIERAVLDSTVRITLALDRETPFSHEVLAGPPRAFVDLFGATAAEPLQDAAIRYEAGAVRQVRVGRRSGAVRVVLDLEGATPVSVFTLYNPYRVVIDAEQPAAARSRTLTAAGSAVPTPASAPSAIPPAMPTPAVPPVVVSIAPSAPVVPVTVAAGPEVQLVDERDVDLSLRPAPPETDEFVAAPALTAPPAAAPAGGASPAVGPAPGVSVAARPVVEPVPSAPEPARLPVPPSTPAPTVPAANTDGSFSLARQLGLGISRIVIDAGHGGHDPGTLTSGTNEARLVLDVALRLEKLLAKDGFDVVLTRRTDTFIPLEQRTAIANREGADLFLSIHANASRDPKARGIEVYYLSFASNPEAEAVAARENATSAGGMHNLPGIVRAIALNNKLDESRDLAAMVQQSLTARLSKTNAGLRSRGVKKAPFVVLIGAQMPSILAEIGFITNRQEVALIKTPAYRQKIAESLQAAVAQYRRSLKRQTAVATR
ncbi:MAG: N-acetylmuramoyl-L-alanine amidase [Acidobacteria bacterium]|nr:N-acetylmuramoyl-L-alanine amidase [Acidobacteriota bacterium]